MKVLAIDTSSIVATCAVMDDEKLIGEYILNHKKTHSQKIMPVIKEILDSCELDTEDIDVYGVAKGPGSFTGLRIGLATIKGLAHATDKPVVGISTLEALAFNIPYSQGIIVPMMDAKRQRVYTGLYKWQDGVLCVIDEPMAIEVEELIKILLDRNEKIIVNGDGSIVYKPIILEKLKSRVLFAPKSANLSRASSVAELTMARAKEGKLESYMKIVPDYLRKSQAQREYDEKIQCSGEYHG